METKFDKFVKEWDWKIIGYTVVSIWSAVAIVCLPTKEVMTTEFGQAHAITFTHILLFIVFLYTLNKLIAKYDKVKLQMLEEAKK